MTQTADNAKTQDPGVASAKENAKLEHSVDGATTRDDRHDLGVPMRQGDGSEPVGPEDALGEGPKRGDYADRTRGSELAHEARELDGGGEDVVVHVNEAGEQVKEGAKDAVGTVVVDRKPRSEIVHQTPRASDQGEVEGKKGGVETAGEKAA